MKFYKKVVCLGLCFCFICLAPFCANASEGDISTAISTEYNFDAIATEYYSDELITPFEETIETVGAIGTDLEINAKSVVLLEPKTGKILYEKNSHEKLAPASITKIMSLLLIMEAIDAGTLSLDTVISASEHACSMGGSQIWLEPNETMTVNDLLKASFVASANDATVALGEAVAGSEESFVAMMNSRGKELGLLDTNFVNATGLDADGHLTSAYDVAIMSAALIGHQLVKNYSTIWMDSLRNGEIGLVNTNKLVRFYEGATGLKTGTTSQAGSCLAATAERSGMELVAVVMGSSNSTDRFNGARKLLDYGFANWSFLSVIVGDENLTPIPVKGGTALSVDIAANQTKSILVPKGKRDSVSQEVTIETELEAPVKEGQQVGVSRIVLEGEELGVIPITAVNDVKKMTFLVALTRILKYVLYL